MKKVWCFCLFCGVLALSAVVISAAEQEEEPGVALIWKDKVKAPMMQDYIQYGLKFKEIYEKTNFPWSVFCYQYLTDVYNVIPLQSFAEIDTAGATFDKIKKQIGEEWEQLNSDAGNTIESAEAWFVAYREDLSYIPEVPNYDPDQEEPLFLTRVEYFTLPGKDNEFEECMKEFVELCKEKKAKVGYRAMQTVFSNDLPSYVIIATYNNIEDFGKQAKEQRELLGDEAKAIYAKGGQFVRKMDQKIGIRNLKMLNYNASEESETEEIGRIPTSESEIEGIWEMKEANGVNDDFFAKYRFLKIHHGGKYLCILINKESNMVEHVHGGSYTFDEGKINSQYQISLDENAEGIGNKGAYTFRIKDGKLYQSGALEDTDINEVWAPVKSKTADKCDDSISGVWELKEAEYNNTDQSEMLSEWQIIKILQNGMVIVLMLNRNSHNIYTLHGGSYTFDGEKHVENIEFASENSKNVLNQSFTFKISVKENGFFQEGKVLDTDLKEKWERAKFEE